MAQRTTNNPDCQALAATIASNLKRRRLSRALTQAQVAEIAGVSVESFSRIERGLSLPSFPTLIRLAALYCADPGDLINSGVTAETARSNPRVTRTQAIQGAGDPAGTTGDQRTADLFLRLIDAARSMPDADLAHLVATAESLAIVHNQP